VWEFHERFVIFHSLYNEASFFAFSIPCLSNVEFKCGQVTTITLPNLWRTKAASKIIWHTPINLYCDDTSGNVLKQWNKHISYYFMLAGLPQQFQTRNLTVISCVRQTLRALWRWDSWLFRSWSKLMLHFLCSGKVLTFLQSNSRWRIHCVWHRSSGGGLGHDPCVGVPWRLSNAHQDYKYTMSTIEAITLSAHILVA
jgi:hypothetical protein